MDAHAKKRVELYSSLKKEVLETVGELSKVCLFSTCPDMHLFGAHRRTWHSFVCKQTATSRCKVNQGL